MRKPRFWRLLFAATVGACLSAPTARAECARGG